MKLLNSLYYWNIYYRSTAQEQVNAEKMELGRISTFHSLILGFKWPYGSWVNWILLLSEAIDREFPKNLFFCSIIMVGTVNLQPSLPLHRVKIFCSKYLIVVWVACKIRILNKYNVQKVFLTFYVNWICQSDVGKYFW